MKKQLLKTFLLFGLFFISPHFARAATYYVDGNAANDSGNGTIASPKKYIKSGAALLYAGDTLVIKNGTYKGTQNMLNYCESDAIRSGSAGSWVTIKAENMGGVTIDGEGVNLPVCFKGNDLVDGSQGPYVKMQYLQLDGLVTQNARTGQSTIYFGYIDHVKILNTGSADAGDGNASPFQISYSTDMLLENCYSWGAGRYKFAFFHSFNSIMRNCVARSDRAVATASGDPTAIFSVYSSANIEVQNCIAIDSDQSQFWLNANEFAGAFSNPATTPILSTGPVNYNNVIAVSNSTRYSMVSDDAYIPDVHFKNCAGVDLITMLSNSLLHGKGKLNLDQCTFSNIDNNNQSVVGAYFNSSPGPTHNSNGATNTIWQNFAHGGLFYYNVTSDYNDVFNIDGQIDVFGTTSTNTKTLNPSANGLLYPVRIESGSALESAGKSGARIGANILKQYGKSGTLWGEAGYNLLQDGTNGQADVNMWPFPNEDLIKQKFQAYSYTGPKCTTAGVNCTADTTGTISGDRGFASSTAKQLDGKTPVTLTSYIWESLGNQMPCEIYGTCTGDVIAPAVPTNLSVQ